MRKSSQLLLTRCLQFERRIHGKTQRRSGHHRRKMQHSHHEIYSFQHGRDCRLLAITNPLNTASVDARRNFSVTVKDQPSRSRNLVLSDVEKILQISSPQHQSKSSYSMEQIQELIDKYVYSDENSQVLIEVLDHLLAATLNSSEDYQWMSAESLFPLLNTAIYRWRDEYLQLDQISHTILKPSLLIQKLQFWQENFEFGADTGVYTMILDAISKKAKDPHEGVDLANSLLEWMVAEAQERQNYLVQPSVVSVGTVMKAWVASQRYEEAREKIEDWLDRVHTMHQNGWPNLEPNVVLYNTLLQTMARAKDSKSAEKILQNMVEGRLGVDPDEISFSTVLLAYTMEGTLESMLKAETLLHQMQVLYSSGANWAKPNVQSITTVMNLYAKLGHAEKAEELMEYMLNLYEETSDPAFESDALTYNAVILAWSNAGHPGKADELLQSMITTLIVEPNNQSFHSVLTGWVNSGNPQRCEELLQQMHDLSRLGMYNIQPTTVTYNIVLDSWAKLKSETSWRRALDIVKHMDELSEAGNKEVTPNARSWNTVLNCFRYVGKKDFHHAFKVLDLFLYNVDCEKISDGPNSYTWNTLLAACANNTNDDYRVHQIWRLMEKYQCKPDIVTYNTIFSCYAHYGNQHDSAAQALAEFVNIWKNDLLSIPSKKTYSNLIDAWIALGRIGDAEKVLAEICQAESPNEASCIERGHFHKVLKAVAAAGKARRVESIVRLMQELQTRDGLEHLKPDLTTYNILLNGWARSNDGQAGERVDLIFREMTVRGIKPTRISYNMVLNAWANSGDLMALSKIANRVLEMILTGDPELMPDDISYRTWVKAMAKGDKKACQHTISEIRKTMEIHKFQPSERLSNELYPTKNQ